MKKPMNTKNVQIRIAIGAPNTTRAEPTVEDKFAYKPKTPTDATIQTVAITSPGERHVIFPVPRAALAKIIHTNR